MRENQLARARKEFHQQRERLEAKFFTLAARSGKPRGLEWVRCDFEDDVIYARHRQSGELSAFVGVTIGFEAIEGGGMEEVEAVGNARAATAVFRIENGAWATDGRALFNLTPSEAVASTRTTWSSWPKSRRTTGKRPAYYSASSLRSTVCRMPPFL
jgi:hypothetical protein